MMAEHGNANHHYIYHAGVSVSGRGSWGKPGIAAAARERGRGVVEVPHPERIRLIPTPGGCAVCGLPFGAERLRSLDETVCERCASAW